MILAGDAHIKEMIGEHLFGGISMMLFQGVIEILTDIELVFVIHSHIAPHQMRGSGKI
jgi:hypothetical protein